MRMVPLRQVAEFVETTSPQIIKRQELQRRVGIYAISGGEVRSGFATLRFGIAFPFRSVMTVSTRFPAVHDAS